MNEIAKLKAMPVILDEQLRYHARTRPDKIAIWHTDQQISYSELDQKVDQACGHILKKGLNKNDRVFIALKRQPTVVIAFLAIIRCGGIAVPFNFRSSEDEKYQMRQLIKPNGIIYQEELETQIGSVGKPEWKLSDREMLKPGSDEMTQRMTLPELAEEDVVYLNFTSGCTGRPKAAKATHKNLFYNTLASCEIFQISEKDVHLPLFAVMSHPHEIFCRALLTGGSICLLENLYPRTIAQVITKFKVTCIMAVPPVYDLMLPFADNDKYDFSSMRLPESGGMATPVWLQARFKDRFGVNIVPVWGSTETMGIAFANSLGSSPVPNSCGKVIPYYSAKIVDANGDMVKSGDVGELHVKGPGVMIGYWKSQEETQTVLKDGWYRTGDLFCTDERDNYFYRGRKDAMIKVGGLKVYPAEIEAVLFSHPVVREAVVVPFHDRLRGFVPLAAIVTEPGETLTEAQLKDYVGDRLAKYKMPRIFRFLPYLPRTSGGKIDLKALTVGSPITMTTNEQSIESRLEAIDLKILHLLNERLKYVLELRQLTRHEGFQPERTQEIVKRLKEFNPGPIHDSVVEEIFVKILSLDQYL